MISEDWQYGVIGRRTKHVADTTSQLAVRVSFANSERVFLTKIVFEWIYQSETH